MTSKSHSSWEKLALLACLAVFVSASSLSFAQQLTGTLSGTTKDTTGAVVVNAKITMKNQLSGDMRTSVSNSTGYFSITAIQPGTYTVTITAAGFKEWKEANISFAEGDNRTLPQIALQIGAVTETVEISSGALTVPTDNAEISATIPEDMVNSFPMGNRDAGELLKIMPGMAFSNGASQGSGFSDKVVGTNTGPIGSFSANGTQPNGAMAFMLDGANLVDPGNAGTQIANINQDMVSEVKVLMSNYDAEYAKGPVIFEAFSKSGGSRYHGELYTYARNSALNAIDAYTHSQIVSGATTAALAAPAESYYYMGGNIGGPIPFLTRGRQKLFFWGGYEYMRQHPAGSIINYNVPTAEQLTGDFSNTTENGIPGSTMVSTGVTLTQQLQNSWGYAYDNMYAPPAGGSGTSLCAAPPCPAGAFDPVGVAYAGLLPKPNITPNAGNGWSDYQYVSSTPQNRWEATGKIDYAIGDNTKLTGSYTRQIEADQHPVGIWWTPPWTLPYPSNVVANTTSQEVMINGTHVFNPTTTNETVFTLARYVNPNTLSNASAVDRNTLFGTGTLNGFFGYTTKQMPNVTGPWGGTFPDIGEMNLDGPFNGGGFGATKKDPSLYDNFTKVVGSHTIKVGAYWDTSENLQSSSGILTGGNGTFALNWGALSTGNTVADFLIGHIDQYSQPSSDIVNDIKMHQWSIYAQDSFKASSQMTVNYGLRMDHVGQWYGPSNGMAVWDPASYVNGTPCVSPCSGTSTAITNPNTGLLWHSLNSSVPLSGWESPLFYYEPRVGFAYDIFGNGKTVVRGGFASFRYQVAVNDVGGAANLASGIFTPSMYNLTNYSNINNFIAPTGAFVGAANGTGISAMQMGDNRTPYTNDWNISIAEALPWRSVLEVSYIGNQSRNELINGANGKLDDLNAIQPGGYYFPDPTTPTQPNGTALYLSGGAPPCNNGDASTDYVGCGSMGPNAEPLSANYGGSNPAGMSSKAAFTQNNYRPLTNYTDIYLITHGSYANYNALQTSWKKQSGSVSYFLNYSFSKVMGIRDGQSDNGPTNGTTADPFNLRENYGPLAYDHTQIFNATYVWHMPKFVHGNRILEGTVNGWQLSGYTTYQTGAPLQPNGTLNFTWASNLTVPLAGAPDLPDNSLPLPNGLRTNQVNAATWYGTDQTGGGYENFLPQITCDPRNHAKGLYFNPSCFGTPAFGQLGTRVWPYIKAPAYFDSDLGIYKSFKVTESKRIEFRVQGTNWLNHPLYQFGLGGTGDETINLGQGTAAQYPVAELAGTGTCASLNNGHVDATNPAMCDYTAVSIAPTNTNGTTTGKPGFKTGQRVLTFAAKFYF
jgi:carboxypeptidase family protein